MPQRRRAPGRTAGGQSEQVLEAGDDEAERESHGDGVRAHRRAAQADPEEPVVGAQLDVPGGAVSPVRAAVAFDVAVLEHQVPAVEAILAAVGDGVARLPRAVLARHGEQEAPATAVDAGDLRRGREHWPILAWDPRTVRRCASLRENLAAGKLVSPEGTSTRPTTDRAREAIFNALGSAGLIDGALVADLFAGTGAVGIEALSRGAAHCTFVERDRNALRALEENVDTLDLAQRTRIVRSDAGQAAATLDVDIAFIDPPYDFERVERIAGHRSGPVRGGGVGADDRSGRRVGHHPLEAVRTGVGELPGTLRGLAFDAHER